MGFAKMGANGSCVSAFCFSIWLHIKFDVINLASVSRAYGILFPPLGQALNVSCHAKMIIAITYHAGSYQRQ